MTNLINPQGRLIDIAKLVDLNTVQHASEIQKDRLTDKDLRSMWFWTSDFPLYTMNKDEVVLNMATCENNLLFKNIDDAVAQLREKNNYFPKSEDVSSVVSGHNTLPIALNGLNLQKHGSEWSYFEIDTKKYGKTLNSLQKIFAERVHGKGEDFEKVMEMLAKEGKISTTKIYTLNPEYVKNTLKNNNVESLARGGFLYIFSGYSNFDASNWDVDGNGRRLRGVSSGAEGAKQKITPSKSEVYVPSEAKVWEIFTPYIADVNKSEVKNKLSELYKR